MGASFQAPHATPRQRPILDGLPLINLARGQRQPQNYMGASFQAPHAAPGQRQMEMHHDH